MIRLKLNPEVSHKCPRCQLNLNVKGILIPGMRNLADLECCNCNGAFYGDLASGQALYSPMLLDKSTGEVYDNYNVKWFADWLTDSYKNRNSEPLNFKVENFSPVGDKVVLLNCIDTLYGHSLLKLLNAQYYLDHRPDVSVIALVPKFLEWMLPVGDDKKRGIAEAWIVGLPLRRGTEWNDWLASEINNRLADFSEVFLSVGFSHPHPHDFDIERFTKIKPFDLKDWKKNLTKPCVTFIWREDRLWESDSTENKKHSFENIGKLKQRFGKRKDKTREQFQKVIDYSEALRQQFPAIDFAVAGIGGKSLKLPDWISDLRFTEINSEIERRWCERFAKSQIVVGVHGSNMLLPSAHAGAVIELIGEERHGNFLQDILFRPSDFREMLFRYRFVPPATTPEELAKLTAVMLNYESFRELMSPEFSSHGEGLNFFRDKFNQPVKQ